MESEILFALLRGLITVIIIIPISAALLFASLNAPPKSNESFLMNSTLVGQVIDVADESLIMPHKSTYFYPKVLTGLVINKFNV